MICKKLKILGCIITDVLPLDILSILKLVFCSDWFHCVCDPLLFFPYHSITYCSAISVPFIHLTFREITQIGDWGIDLLNLIINYIWELLNSNNAEKNKNWSQKKIAIEWRFVAAINHIILLQQQLHLLTNTRLLLIVERLSGGYLSYFQGTTR